MPTTLTSLLLFIALLLPGFAYVVGKERAGTERRASPFRETVAVAAASVAADLFVIVTLSWWWSRHVCFERLVREPGRYWKDDPTLLARWGVILLAAATAVAYLWTWPTIRALPGKIFPERLRRKLPRRMGRALALAYPHPSSVSAWWLLFESDREADKIVGLNLDDKSYIEGKLKSYNTDANDTPDRDIILGKPIKIRPSGSKKTTDYPVSAVSISARRIVAMFVTNEDPDAGPAPEPPPVVRGRNSVFRRRRRRRSRQPGQV